MAARRVDPPISVPLLILTDADTGRKVAVNGGWMTTFTEGDREGTTLFRFTNGDLLTVEEDFVTVAEMFVR
ncbi:MAG TPA: hypothetical protein VNA69_19965 [Thermoanaerobaculia bacterium]|nr:hypothetical protein [Thermoanaerobaculia bacterium]